MKTFEFTEQEAELLRKEQYKYLINDNIDHFLLLVQQIVSERITPEPGESVKPVPSIPIVGGGSVASDRTEPGESGQSAEDVESIFYKLCDIARRDGASIEYLTKPNAIKAMRLHASQVCADKEADLQDMTDLRESAMRTVKNLADRIEPLQNEIDRLNESMTVMVRKNAELEKELEYAKIR